MQFICPNGTPIDLNSVSGNSGSGGNIQSQYPNLNAKRLNLSIQDVQRTIQEGRAAGNIKIFNISGSTLLKN